MAVPVTLNKSEVNFLAKIADPKVRAATQRKILAEKQDKRDANAVKWEETKARWQAKREAELTFKVTELGYLIFPSGTRRDCIMSPERARELVQKFDQLREVVASMPETAKKSSK